MIGWCKRDDYRQLRGYAVTMAQYIMDDSQFSEWLQQISLNLSE